MTVLAVAFVDMTKNVCFKFKLVEPIQKINTSHVLAFEAEVHFVPDTLWWPMGYQYIGIVGDLLPLFIK